ncbi:MAG: TetR family transcriptional regulator [Bifidobacterium aquikefiri]|uniref:Transcriptional regulator, TetR family n=1 Tax=Bifidobacterium aquikefiri TaxID=1653207 RepID=A0A261G6N9_9BIFI|nr:TetR family transcriptional regulator [Bifidobacterium aquikefiri]OZG67090.1 transcriptional regulator, TetR family [Bifidobacterium aquikefiri]
MSNNDRCDPVDKESRRGRPSEASSQDTEGQILQAARVEFGHRGYDDATIRIIAQRAGCDPKLVHYYFGSKDMLFSKVIVDIYKQQNLGGILEKAKQGEPLEIATTFAEEYLRTAEMPGIHEAYVALIRGIGSNEHIRTIFLKFLHEQIMALTSTTLKLDHATLRTTLFGSQLLGLANTRYVLKLEPLASMPIPQVAQLIGPTLKHYLFDELAFEEIDHTEIDQTDAADR